MTNLYWEGIDISQIDPGYLKSVEDFAAERNIADRLMRTLDQLRSMARSGAKPVLFKDFAPYSFIFDLGWIFGGMIYYGPGDTGSTAPQFSTRIGSTDEGWTLNS